jgi:K+-sensing histidine kinase KdpD
VKQFPVDDKTIAFLSEVGRGILGRPNLGSVSWRLVLQLREKFQYSFAAIAMLNEDELVWRAGSGGSLDADFNEPRDKDMPQVEQELAAEVMRTGKMQSSPVVNETLEGASEYRLVVPICYRDRALGVIAVGLDSGRVFAQRDLEMLEAFASLLASPLNSARMAEKERRRFRHLRLVNEISSLVMSSLGRVDLLRASVRAIRDSLDVTFVGVMLVDAEGRVIDVAHSISGTFKDDVDQQSICLKEGEGLVGKVIASGESIRVGDVRDFAEYRALVLNIRSSLAVPLRIRGDVIGVLLAEHRDGNHFNADHEDLLENLSGYLAQAVDNSRLFEMQRERWQQLVLINEIARTISQSSDLEETASLLVHQVHGRFDCCAVALWLLEEGDRVLTAVKSDGSQAFELGHRTPIELGDDLAKAGELLSHAICGCSKSVLCVPLSVGDTIIGGLQLERRVTDAFGEPERLTLETLGRSVAGAIANARLVRKTEAMREDFNRMIVHDLRNPLQVVQLAFQELELAADEVPGRITEAIEGGKLSTSELLRLTNSLLDVSRFEAGKTNLRRRPSVVNDHLRMVVRRFAGQAKAKKIDLKTEFDHEIPVLSIDHELIERTIANLVGNALKFTGASQSVEVRSLYCPVSEPGSSGDAQGDRAEGQTPHVRIDVVDAGEGIPEEYQKSIFEKFSQVETRKAGLKMSTGLGLTFCRYVVHAHGGDIWVRSVPGEGATFSFTIPISR